MAYKAIVRTTEGRGGMHRIESRDRVTDRDGVLLIETMGWPPYEFDAVDYRGNKTSLTRKAVPPSLEVYARGQWTSVSIYEIEED